MLEIIALIIVGGMVGIAYLLSYVVEFFAAIILGLFWGVVELIKSAISPKETEKKETEKTTATKAVEAKKEEEKKENINNTETDREEKNIDCHLLNENSSPYVGTICYDDDDDDWDDDDDDDDDDDWDDDDDDDDDDDYYDYDYSKDSVFDDYYTMLMLS